MTDYLYPSEGPAFDGTIVSGERNEENAATMQNLCKKYMNYHVMAQMKDGSQKEGIIEDVDDQGVIMLVPEDVGPDNRQFGGYGYGPRPRFRRFRRFRFPFFVFAFPFVFPYPYYY